MGAPQDSLAAVLASPPALLTLCQGSSMVMPHEMQQVGGGPGPSLKHHAPHCILQPSKIRGGGQREQVCQAPASPTRL